MDCRTAEGLVNRYIEHELPVNELEAYFIVHEVTQQLDDNSSESVLDFKDLLEQDISSSRHYVRKKKIGWFLIGVSVCLLIAALAAILVYVLMETAHIL